MAIVQKPTLVIRLFQRMRKKRQLPLVGQVRDVLQLFAALLIPRKLELSLPLILQEESAVSPVSVRNTDGYPRPPAVELHPLIDCYLDLAHRSSIFNTGFPGEPTILRQRKCRNVVQL
jgi:hypothetical protein